MTPTELIAALVTAAGLLGAGASPETIGAALGAEFAPVGETGSLQIWQAPGTAPVARWDLRLPMPGATFGGLVLATFAPPGLDETVLEPVLAAYEIVSIDVVSPPIDAAPGWLPLHSSCHVVPEARLCVTWEGLDNAHAIELAVEPGAR